MMSRPNFPLAEFCNLEIEEISPGHAVGTVKPDFERHANPHGVLHGAIVFTAVDTAMGAATKSVLGPNEICATIEVQIRFLRTVTEGTIRADTKVMHQGRRVLHLESKVIDDAGKLVALATGSFAVLPQP